MDEKTYVKGFHLNDSVNKMIYNDLGKTGLRVSQMTLGCGPFSTFYATIDEDECENIVVEAIRNGVNFLDTSPWYGQRTSERIVGQALKKVPRKAYYIGTKVGRYELDDKNMFDFSKEKTRESVEKSLKLLGLDYIDFVQVHDVEFSANLDEIIEETLPTLQQLKKEGKLRYIGITGYITSVLKEIILKSSVKIDVVLSYARNTLVDNSLEDYLPFFKSRDIGVINACATAMGLFTTNGPPTWHPATAEIKNATKDAIRYIEKSYPSVQVSRLSVLHSLKMNGIATHAFGSTTMDILRKNLQAIFAKATREEEKAIKDIRERFFVPLKQKHWEGNQDLEKYHTIENERNAAK